MFTNIDFENQLIVAEVWHNKVQTFAAHNRHKSINSVNSGHYIALTILITKQLRELVHFSFKGY